MILNLARSGVRQHALLNLSRMHYLQHEHEAAHKVSSFSIASLNSLDF